MLIPLVRVFRRFEQVASPAPVAETTVTAVVAVLGVVITSIGMYAVSQIGLDGLFVGGSEPLAGVSVSGAMAAATLAAGILLLRLGPRAGRYTRGARW
jgi:hypothetical protein